MGNGSSDSDIRNDCNFGVDHFDKIIGTGIKSNDRCADVSYEWLGSYDASFLTRFRHSNAIRKNILIGLEWSDTALALMMRGSSVILLSYRYDLDISGF